MKRVVGLLVGAYLLAAIVGLVRERMGFISCGCAEDCWCQRPGLQFFRWVFPRGHRSRMAGQAKPLPPVDLGATLGRSYFTESDPKLIPA